MFEIFGDGGAVLGSAGWIDQGAGTLNIAGAYYIQNVKQSMTPYLGNVSIPGGHMIPDDPYWEDEIFRGPTNGPGLYNGQLTVNANSNPSSGAIGLIVNGGASNSGAYALFVNSPNTAGNSFGASIQAGTTSTDSALQVKNAANTLAFLQIFGDGHGTLGPSATTGMSWTTGGVAVHSSSVGVKGPIPAVTAGQTDIGITTTATVITTAGGISLPALASTFWVVNVNGVAYGIPCFAL
jgi:hypothetical protein